MDIGVFGGTFDPIHSGHLMIAEESRLRIGLSRILFVPAGQPWLKVDRTVTSSVHRMEMIRRAIAPNSHFELSTAEIDRPGPSYTVGTIAILQKRLGAKARIFFLLGWDSLATLPRWKEPGRLVKMCQLVAIPRPKINTPDLDVLETSIPGIRQSVTWLDMPFIDISSSGIRKLVYRGESINSLVPEQVERYIEEQKLYR